MIPAFERHRNADGTYDGVGVLAELSGLTRAEIAWTAMRLKALFAGGASKAEAKRIVAEEAKSRPWERPA